MTASLPAAMRLLETSRLEEAAAAFEPISGPTDEGVIARFRRAECLSRLGRHDEAVEEARRAHADAPDAPATASWLAQVLAEAGRFGEAASVSFPDAHREFVGPVAAGWAGLAKLADDARADRAGVVEAILGSRHAPIYSLAIRLAEGRRLAVQPRWPDLPSVWYRHECELEMEEDGVAEHPAAPSLAVREGFLGRWISTVQASEVLRWLRLHAACGDWSDLLGKARTLRPDDPAVPEIELEMLFALGRIDEAEALTERLAKEAGKDAAGELAIDRCRVAQLRGRAVRPRDFDGFEDAQRRHRDGIAWLDCCAALLEGDALAARAAADVVSDPAHREYVEAALLRWASGRSS